MEKNKIKEIQSIYIMTNVCLNRDITKRNFNTFLVIEMKDNRLIYNINTGKDYSFIKDKNIAIIKGQTEILNLYKQDKKQYQSELEFYELKSIKLYKNSKLKNKYNDRTVDCRVDYIEFKDLKNNTFYISHNINTIYLRDNLYEIIKKNNQVVHTIYEKQTNINLDMKIFKNKTIDILKLFFDFN